MSPLLEKVLQEIEQLTPEEQFQVLSHTTEQLKRRTVAQTEPNKRSWRELRGIDSNLLDGQDAQEWVNQLRREWEKGDKQIFEGL